MTSCSSYSNSSSSSQQERAESTEQSVEILQQGLYYEDQYRWFIEYIVRPQTWLRKRVYDFIQKRGPVMQTPCTVMHVRRNDVVLHGSGSRKFHPISEYLNASETIRPNILLLTDDANAIGEATVNFPQYNWLHIDRPRFRGVGGWEHHIPSDSATFEVVVLFAIFKLVRQCEQIILSTGKFSDYLYEEMKRNRIDGQFVEKVDIDKGKGFFQEVVNGANSNTHIVSQNYEQDKPNLLREKRLTSGGQSVGEPLPRNKEFYGPFCLGWDIDADDWWTHHRHKFEMGPENGTHYCFNPIYDAHKAAFLEELYRIQFLEGDCTHVTTKRMWSTGLGADLENLVDGLAHAIRTRKPFQVGTEHWHYADLSVKQKNSGSRANAIACPKGNMFCYFLDMSRCQPQKSWGGTWVSDPLKDKREYPWFLQYITSPQTWLRKKVYDFTRQQEEQYFTSPCTVLHVRRGDVILHKEHSRKHHTIDEYMDYANLTKKVNVHKNVLLLTDDANAITEAKEKYPLAYNWMYISRPRQGSQDARWEHHLPSLDPVYEMVVLQSIFRMVKQCDQLIHSTSNFAQHLLWEMESTGKHIINIDIDEGKKESEIYNSLNYKNRHVSLNYPKV